MIRRTDEVVDAANPDLRVSVHTLFESRDARRIRRTNVTERKVSRNWPYYKRAWCAHKNTAAMLESKDDETALVDPRVAEMLRRRTS